MDLDSNISVALHRKLENARAKYQTATDEYRRLMGIAADIYHPKDPGAVDGRHAMRRAMAIHARARLEYEQALQEFTDFVMLGKRRAETKDTSPDDSHS